MKTAKELNIIIEEAISKQIFDMTRDEFIAEAKEVAGDNWAFIEHYDDFQNALDHTTIEALQAYRLSLAFSKRLLAEFPNAVMYLDRIILVIPTIAALKPDTIFESE